MPSMCDLLAFLGSLMRPLGKLVSELQAGDWPTVVGAAFAGAAAILALLTLRSQQRETAKRNAFDKRSQASQIVAWVEDVDAPPPYAGSSFGSGAHKKMLRLINPSGIPVFSVVVEVYSESEDPLTTWEHSLLPPLDGFREIDISDVAFERGECLVSVTLTDADGTRWLRERRTHRLVEVAA